LNLSRLRRAARDEGPFVSVVLIVGLGFCYVLISHGHWLRGVAVMAFGMVVAGLLRAALPAGRAGLLVVRGRLFDTLCYVSLGLAVFGFSVLVPQ
jgi:Protein of unknown function (DUF3017)